MIFFCKNTIFCNSPPKTIFLLSLEENEDAGIKHPVNLKHPQKTSIGDQADPMSSEIAWIPIFLPF